MQLNERLNVKTIVCCDNYTYMYVCRSKIKNVYSEKISFVETRLYTSTINFK